MSLYISLDLLLAVRPRLRSHHRPWVEAAIISAVSSPMECGISPKPAVWPGPADTLRAPTPNGVLTCETTTWAGFRPPRGVAGRATTRPGRSIQIY